MGKFSRDELEGAFRYCELYTAYEWHVVDEDQGRVVVHMQNRRDHPSGAVHWGDGPP